MEFLQKIIQTYLPMISENPLIQAALIFLFASILAFFAKKILGRLQSHAEGYTANAIDDYMFSILKRPVSMSILLIGFYLAVFRSGILDKQLVLLESILVSIAIFTWLSCVLKGARFALNHFSRDDARIKMVQPHTLPLFENLAVIVLYGVAIYFVFVAWEINVSAWVASAGILGIALSFAAKDTLANLFAGVFILADSPYKIGDFIVLDSGERGKVTHIGIRSTRILTRADVEITVPNAIMGNTKITNETAGPSSKYRIRVQIGAAYGSDISQVREALMAALDGIENIESDPEPRVRFRNFGDSSLNFELLCWIGEPVLRGAVSDKLNEAVYNEFNRRKIQIPFPQRDVHLRQVNPD